MATVTKLSGLQTATKIVAIYDQNINLQVKFFAEVTTGDYKI